MAEVKIGCSAEPSIPDEKGGPIGSQDGCRENTEDHIVWTDPRGKRIRTVEEQYNMPSIVITTLKLDTVDCHCHVDAIKEDLVA